MTPRRFKCSQFGKDALDFDFECINMLQNDFCKQRYIILNAAISGQDRIYPKTHLCRTFLLSLYMPRFVYLERYFMGVIAMAEGLCKGKMYDTVFYIKNAQYLKFFVHILQRFNYYYHHHYYFL